ncbi:MAG: hypothetical protein J5790_03620 [Bacteroidaceae bacterium]|nr:hypothetical protein [Bacteroidaceae bacterium]
MKKIIGYIIGVAALLLVGCYSNNCPLENTVTCNYGFYDAEGTSIYYVDTITVTTLMPGYKTVYTYRKLGNKTVTKDTRDTALVNLGYTETASQQRKDTILLNQLMGATNMKVPMSYFHEEDTLILSYKMILRKDTIKIRHSSYANVELPECGTYRFHTLQNISSTDAAIDHIEISNSKVNYDGNINVKIYFNGVVTE